MMSYRTKFSQKKLQKLRLSKRIQLKKIDRTLIHRSKYNDPKKWDEKHVAIKNRKSTKAILEGIKRYYNGKRNIFYTNKWSSHHKYLLLLVCYGIVQDIHFCLSISASHLQVLFVTHSGDFVQMDPRMPTQDGLGGCHSSINGLSSDWK